jgi:hypothetical protein
MRCGIQYNLALHYILRAARKKPALVFFVEGFSIINAVVNNKTYYYDGNLTNIRRRALYTDFALGFGLVEFIESLSLNQYWNGTHSI